MTHHPRTPAPRDRRRAGAGLIPAALILVVATVAAAQSPPSTTSPPADSPRERYRLEDGQWRQQGRLDPASPEGKLQAIRKALAAGDAAVAQDRATEWIERYPNHPLLVEAYLVRGDARVSQGKEYRALYDYEYVIRQFPASEQFNTALEREFGIARLYAAGRKRKFLGMRILSAGEEAEEIFIRIQERSPGSELGEKSSLALGDFYYNRGEMTKAAEAFGLFIVNYPRSLYRERSMLRVIQANLARFKGPNFDPTGLIEAAERIKQYQREYPAAAERIGAEALLVRINESLAQKVVHNGSWYQDRSQRWSAITMYRRTLRDYPQTAAARAAADRLAALGEPAVAAQELPSPPPRRPSEPATLKVPAGEAVEPSSRPAAEERP